MVSRGALNRQVCCGAPSRTSFEHKATGLKIVYMVPLNLSLASVMMSPASMRLLEPGRCLGGTKWCPVLSLVQPGGCQAAGRLIFRGLIRAELSPRCSASERLGGYCLGVRRQLRVREALTSGRRIARLRQAMFGGPDRGLRAGPESQFAENVLHVHLGGTLAYDEGCRDVAVAQSAGQQPVPPRVRVP